MTDTAYLAALAYFPKFGPKAFQKLHAFFPTMKEAFFAQRNDLLTAGLSPKMVDEFLDARESLSPERIWESLQRQNISVIPFGDDAYPELLANIYDPPALLFVKGTLPSSSSIHLGIVGSRRATSYGLRAAKEFSTHLSQQGMVIVSGLAYGIDEAAHQAVVHAGAKTVAVLACGFNTISSRQYQLMQRIVETGGAVISEFSPNTHAMKQYFPIRNRIISGMSHGVFVIEAAEQSGSLITAKSALEQGRDVFALPGSIYADASKGTNMLIKQGAHVVTEYQDILDVLHVPVIHHAVQPYIPKSKEEALVLEHVCQQPIHINELIRCTQLSPHVISGILAELEIHDRVQQIGGMYYILT